MKTITTACGKSVMLDDGDYLLLHTFSWRLVNGYAAHTYWDGAKSFTIFMHRAIAGAPRGKIVDHVNHNPLDNRRENLRLATGTQNNANTRPKDDKKSSRFKGVYKSNGKRRPWRAVIVVGGSYLSLGSYPSEEQAARAYDLAAEKYFGEFACKNL